MMPPQRIVPAILNREIDAVAIWEPYGANAAHALGDDAIEFGGDGIYRELFNLNATAGALADPVRRREIVGLLREIIDVTAKLNRDPAEAQAAIAASGGYTLEEIVRCWPHHDFVAGFADDMLDVLAREEIWLAGEEKRRARSREELAPLIDRSVYAEALALRPAR